MECRLHEDVTARFADAVRATSSKALAHGRFELEDPLPKRGCQAQPSNGSSQLSRVGSSPASNAQGQGAPADAAQGVYKEAAVRCCGGPFYAAHGGSASLHKGCCCRLILGRWGRPGTGCVASALSVAGHSHSAPRGPSAGVRRRRWGTGCSAGAWRRSMRAAWCCAARDRRFPARCFPGPCRAPARTRKARAVNLYRADSLPPPLLQVENPLEGSSANSAATGQVSRQRLGIAVDAVPVYSEQHAALFVPPA